jgi:type I restriction enzyme S subunit
MKYPKKRLDVVAEILMGQAPPGESYNLEGNGWPLLAGAGDFKGSHPVAKKFTTEAAKISMPGDIVIGVRASIGDKVVADREYCLGRGVAALRASAELHDRYLWHWLSSIKSSLEAKGKGATFKQVTKEDIAELEIPLPPLEEQRLSRRFWIRLKT